MMKRKKVPLLSFLGRCCWYINKGNNLHTQGILLLLLPLKLLLLQQCMCLMYVLTYHIMHFFSYFPFISHLSLSLFEKIPFCWCIFHFMACNQSTFVVILSTANLRFITRIITTHHDQQYLSLYCCVISRLRERAFLIGFFLLLAYLLVSFFLFPRNRSSRHNHPYLFLE